MTCYMRLIRCRKATRRAERHTEHAQVTKLPRIINGRIGHPGDVDVFRFYGRAGEEIVAEVYARRLDSPLDSLLTLADAAGRCSKRTMT